MEKKKRGRPSKVKGLENITIKKGKRGRPAKSIVDTPQDEVVDISKIEEEEYIPPKIERKMFTVRMDWKLFHELNDKVNGDIVKLSYIINNIMVAYVDSVKSGSRIIIDKSPSYTKWSTYLCGSEPIVIEDIARSKSLMAGVSLHYKYFIIVDYDVLSTFRDVVGKYCYPPYALNELIKMYLQGKIHIDIGGYEKWLDL